MPKYEFIEIKNEEDIIDHEKLLYDAFINRSPDDWILNHYERIDNCRLKAPYPYSDLLVFGVRKDKILAATLAVNLNTKNKMQLEEEGFDRDKIDITSNFAEGLTFCTTGKNFTIDDWNAFEDGMKFFINEFKKHDLQKIYGTCIERLKIFYLKLGFQIIEKKETEFGNVLLLELKVQQ